MPPAYRKVPVDRNLWAIRETGTDRWLRYSTDVVGKLYAYTDVWDSKAGPPSVFTKMDLATLLLFRNLSGKEIEPVPFLGLSEPDEAPLWTSRTPPAP